jgi:dolichyl-phosphate beta-glucosyltransferase
MPKLSVIIPAYNEEKNLDKGSLNEVHDYLSKQSYSYEVLVVDDGSVDKTAEKVEEVIKGKKNFRLIKNEHGGKAITVMTGLLKSSGEIALFTDLDQSTPLKEIEKFFPEFEQGFNVVIGRRQGRKGAPPIRKLYSWGFSVLRNIVLGLPFSDTQCGFKAFTREAVEKIFPPMLEQWKKVRSQGAAVNAGFDIETLFIAKKRNLKTTDVEVEWHYVGSERVGIKAAIEALKDTLRIRLSDLLGKYN